MHNSQIFSAFTLISHNFLGEKCMFKKKGGEGEGWGQEGDQNQFHEAKTFENIKYEPILRT